MAIVVMITFLVGMILGLRFRVLILLPVIAIVLAAVFAGRLAHAEFLTHVTLAAILSVTCLQLGYLGGVISRCLLSTLPRQAASSRAAHPQARHSFRDSVR